MQPNANHFNVLSGAEWIGWPSAETLPTGQPFRPIAAGSEASILFAQPPEEDSLLVVGLGEQPLEKLSANLQLFANGIPLRIHQKKECPLFLLARVPRPAELPPSSLEIKFRAASFNNGQPMAKVLSALLLPVSAGRFSRRWTSLPRAIRSLVTGTDGMTWDIADFPYSHFDGLGYLLEYAEARHAVIHREYSSAYHYFHKKGHQLGHRLKLAIDRPPLPGTRFNLLTYYGEENAALNAAIRHNLNQYRDRSHHLAAEVHRHRQRCETLAAELSQLEQKTGTQVAHLSAESSMRKAESDTLRSELSETKEENELLLHQLHQVQEELEKYFLENRDLEGKLSDLQQAAGASARECDALHTKLSDLEKTHQELVTRHSSLATAEKDLTIAHETAIKERDELKSRLTAIQAVEAKTAADLEAKLAALAGAHTTERDAMQNENAQLKVRLAELETKHSTLDKIHQELVARHTELVTSENNLAMARDTAIKERDQALSDRDNVVKEREALKRTAGEHSSRILELEAQLAENTERQRTIDEEMAKVEGQLEILTELLRPSTHQKQC